MGHWCGEDILILVVQTPPEPLVSRQPMKGAVHFPATPMIFVSYGGHVVERFGTVDTYTLPYALEPLRRIVDEANSNLRNAYPLIKNFCNHE
uniref:Uncharacterized protein n=1 Tax=Ditylenchus dipsaci TaxID=166011 RepID=A0A915DYZ9_9BILA